MLLKDANASTDGGGESVKAKNRNWLFKPKQKLMHNHAIKTQSLSDSDKLECEGTHAHSGALI